MSNLKNIFQVLVLALIIVIFNGCFQQQTRLEMVIKTGPSLNKGYGEDLAPLMIDFYELKDADRFSKLDYWSITDDGQKQLNNALVSQAKHIFLPNEKHTYKILFNDDSKVLGLVLNFKNADATSNWKYIRNLKQNSHNYIELFVDNNKIEEIK
ncbi:MAG: type VI secretion system lipoprotein TssJ [Arcobacteraceae bacterium]|jgi:type VI secretion system VasD/TssJ family lipoprotein|nr:type VI secretion system lipoprotein TssJ [Arcobacteraceae bacterium]MDY0327722.1 type VI secretion system lipoprotein TssJ [Arcobacteraceae bacterium]